MTRLRMEGASGMLASPEPVPALPGSATILAFSSTQVFLWRLYNKDINFMNTNP